MRVKTVLTNLGPATLLLFAALLLGGHPQWITARFTAPAMSAPPLIGGAICVLALWFRARRIALMCALVVATWAGLFLFPPPLGQGGGATYRTLTVVFPLMMLFLAVRASVRLRLDGMIVLTPVALATIAERGGHALTRHVDTLLHARIFPFATDSWTVLTQPALAAFAAAALGLGIRALITRRAADGAALVVLISALCAFERIGHPLAAALLWTSAVLILAVGLVQDSHAMAFIDELTALPGRRALTMDMDAMSGRYAAAMLDVDHFKKFNDTYGHDTGDQVLRMVASKISRVGGGGRAYRYGGEEFSVLFPAPHAGDAQRHLQAVRAAVAETPFRVRAKNRPRKKPKKGKSPPPQKMRNVTVTISIGLAFREDGEPPHDVLKRADVALYRAKKGGRNRLSE